MTRFDRYVLARLIAHFGFFALILVLVYWVNRAVVLFDQLIANGETALVFLEFSALSLPNVIRLVLPIAAAVAAIYVTNRLAADSELVVVQATGHAPARLARPVLLFGVMVAALLSVLTHVLVPLSVARLAERQVQVAENVTARILREGQFVHPAPGTTVYIREISPRGELLDIYLSDARSPAGVVTYTADRALVVRSDSGPKLVMFDGLVQDLRSEGRRLATMRFTELSYDIGALLGAARVGRPDPRTLPTADLLRAPDALVALTGRSAEALRGVAHDRFNQAALALVAPILAFAVMMLGGFSRFGMARQIVGAAIALIVLKSLDNGLAAAALRGGAPWPLAYGASVLGLAVAFGLLRWGTRPDLWRRGWRGTPAQAAA
ncbi:MAG: LptF/LptG family permease [Rhodobacteraceae bacterium]|nr:LptF/LptG family permease [Paracoccaceae bacterium]